jgi:hypothetical protein
MLKKKLAIAALGLAASASVFANPPHWAPAYGWRAHHAHPYVRYYAPPPVVYRPVAPAPSFSIRLDLPL